MATISAYMTANGKRYRVRYRTPDKRQTDKRGFKTKRDAEQWAASMETSKSRGEFIDATAARATIDVLGTEWLATQTHLKPSTLRTQESAWRVHVQPAWGSRAVGSIRHSEVQTWVTDLSGKQKPTGVIRCYGILSAILDRAEMDRRIPSNPARKVKLPRREKAKRAYLTHAQVRLLASHAREHGTLVRLLAYTGLRWGEATGLRVGHLDMLRRRIHVSENAVMVGGTIVVGTPKTHQNRSVPFPPSLSEGLAVLCEGKSRDDLVFGDGARHLRPPHSQRGWFVSAVKKSQLDDLTFPRVTPHDLRHTTASLAVSAGANVKALQRMLGHASATMTLDIYADLFDDDLDAVADALDHAGSQMSVGRMWAAGS